MEIPTPRPSLETPCSFWALESELPTGCGLPPPCTECWAEQTAHCGIKDAHTSQESIVSVQRAGSSRARKNLRSKEDPKRARWVILHIPPALPPSLHSSYASPSSVPPKNQAFPPSQALPRLVTRPGNPFLKVSVPQLS